MPNRKTATLHLLPRADYVLLDIPNPLVFFGVISLDRLKLGDSLQVSVIMSAGQSKPNLNFKRVFAGPIEDSVIDIPEKYGSSAKIVINQLTGEACEIAYDLRWKDL